jgi:hypothetical protein
MEASNETLGTQLTSSDVVPKRFHTKIFRLTLWKQNEDQNSTRSGKVIATIPFLELTTAK